MSSAFPPPPPPMPVSKPDSRPAGEMDTVKATLNSITSFDRQTLKKTETTITTEDGKTMQESRDDDGNYKTVVTNFKQFGFIPDMRLDLQVGEIRENLFIASQDVAADWEILEKYGITHILNLGTYVKNYFPSKITYRNLQINDYPDANAVRFFDVNFKFIDEGRAKGGVLIHCNAGVSRASTFMIGYLMNREKMPFDQAFNYVKSKRPSIRPNDGFMNQLRMYNETLGFGKAEL